MTRRYYRAFGLHIASGIALPGMDPGDPAKAVDVEIVWQPPREFQRDRVCITVATPPSDGPSFGATEDGSAVLAWGDIVRFVIAPNRRSLTVVCEPDHLQYVPAAVAGMGIGYLLHLRNVLCLHGAVVRTGGRALGVLGASGAGKSTLAAALVAAGAEVISDDVVALQTGETGVSAMPGSRALRLNDDSARHLFGTTAQLDRAPYQGKVVLPPPATRAVEATPMTTIYVLDPSRVDAVSIDPPLPQHAALLHVTANCYPPNQRHLLTPARLRQLRDVAQRVPVRVVRHGRRWADLAALVEAVLA